MHGESILVVGVDAYLAKGLSSQDAGRRIVAVRRWEDRPLSGHFDAVVNFTVQPEFSLRDLPDGELIDARIANDLRGTSAKFVMLSSRRVYGRHDDFRIHSESAPLEPQDAYARNKVRAEALVRSALPNDHLILRVSNILAEPPSRTGYRTFAGWLADELTLKGFVEVTENPGVRKDFISRDYLQKAMLSLVGKGASGTLNVGSGTALPLSRWLPLLVPEGLLRFVDPNGGKRDQFALDVSRLCQYVRPFGEHELLSYCECLRGAFERFVRERGGNK